MLFSEKTSQMCILVWALSVKPGLCDLFSAHWWGRLINIRGFVKTSLPTSASAYEGRARTGLCLFFKHFCIGLQWEGKEWLIGEKRESTESQRRTGRRSWRGKRNWNRREKVNMAQIKWQKRWREMKMKGDRMVGEDRRSRGSHGRGSPDLVRLLFDVSLMCGLVRTVSQGQSWLRWVT